MKTSYGAADPRAAKNRSRKHLHVLFMVCLCCTALVNFFSLAVATFGPFFYPGMTGTTIVVAFVLSCILTASGATNRKRVELVPLGASSAVATAVGAILGLYCYGSYGYFAQLYNHSRTYENVVPSTSAGAVADAGRLLFEAGAKVDQARAIGYGGVTGDRYCAAPVVGPGSEEQVQEVHVEFWAVGMNCCEWISGFACDDAINPNAHSGIVVMDGPDIVGASNRDQYTLAVKKAEARWGIVTAHSPIYVRWVTRENLDLLTSHYLRSAWTFVILATLLYCTLSSPFLYLACRTCKT